MEYLIYIIAPITIATVVIVAVVRSSISQSYIQVNNSLEVINANLLQQVEGLEKLIEDERYETGVKIESLMKKLEAGN